MDPTVPAHLWALRTDPAGAPPVVEQAVHLGRDLAPGREPIVGRDQARNAATFIDEEVGDHGRYR
jgi:hypothetical protein